MGDCTPSGSFDYCSGFPCDSGRNLASLTLDLLVVSHALAPALVASRRLFAKRKLEAPPESPDPPAKTKAEAKAGKAKAKAKAMAEARAKARADAKAKAKAEADAKALATKVQYQTLRCGNCGAPVPLSDVVFPCPYCVTAVVPSPEVVMAHRRLEWAKRSLVRAEGAWKRAVLWNAPRWVFLVGVLYMVWSVAFFYYLFRSPQPLSAMTDFVAWPLVNTVVAAVAPTSAMFGLVFGGVLAKNAYALPKVLGNVPASSFASLPLVKVSCSNCGADVELAEGRLGSICIYCGSEEIRASLAGRAATEARALVGAARHSLIDAYRATTERRETLFVWMDVVALLQLGALAFESPYVGALVQVLQAFT